MILILSLKFRLLILMIFILPKVGEIIRRIMTLDSYITPIHTQTYRHTMQTNKQTYRYTFILFSGKLAYTHANVYTYRHINLQTNTHACTMTTSSHKQKVL